MNNNSTWVGTLEEYNNLETYDEDILYFIIEENTNE